MARYLLRSPLSIFQAIQVMASPSRPRAVPPTCGAPQADAVPRSFSRAAVGCGPVFSGERGRLSAEVNPGPPAAPPFPVRKAARPVRDSTELAPIDETLRGFSGENHRHFDCIDPVAHCRDCRTPRLLGQPRGPGKRGDLVPARWVTQTDGKRPRRERSWTR
jgi:hypothetical protein